MWSKKKWVFISFAFLFISTLLMFLLPYYYGISEIDEKVRDYLIQVHKEKNESYFLEHYYGKTLESNEVKDAELEALRSFSKRYGKLDSILFLEGELGLWTLEEGELLIANYIIVADYDEQKKLKYAISFVKVESDLKFYGFKILDDGSMGL